jgi:enoyl-CoA hydratase
MIDVTLQGSGKNALSSVLMHGLREQLAAAGGAPVLLTGAGDVFSAGLNLVEVATLDELGMLTYLHLLEDTIAALFHYPGPVVAFVNGHAIAGGCVLALCCDLRVVAPDPGIKFGLNEVALGLQFPRGVLRLIRRRVAPQSLDEVVLGGRLYGPHDAVRVGFADEVGDLEVARGRLAHLAGHPAAAYALNKAEIRAGVLDEDPAIRHAYLADALPAWTAPALRARLQGFLGARKPRA